MRLRCADAHAGEQAQRPVVRRVAGVTELRALFGDPTPTVQSPIQGTATLTEYQTSDLLGRPVVCEHSYSHEPWR